MPNLAALFAPLALIVPGTVADQGVPADYPAGTMLLPEAEQVEEPGKGGGFLLQTLRELPARYQVRIERRLVIRVSPRRAPVRQNLMADLPQRGEPREMVERKIGNCVGMKDIAGVQPTRDNRLLLYMRDQKMIAANLEKACSARQFYSGFYIEPSKDGKLCIDRDKLQSRTGAKCGISRLRQLVALDT